MASRYCKECIAFARKHCEGKDATVATHDVCLWHPDDSYEIRPDYIQMGGEDGTRLHGMRFCEQYEFNPALLPKIKSDDDLRAERAEQRAANKEVIDAQKAKLKDEKTKLRAEERKQKAQVRRDKKADEKSQRGAKDKVTPVVVLAADDVADDEFSDLII